MTDIFIEKTGNITNESLHDLLFPENYSATFIFKKNSETNKAIGHFATGWINFNKFDLEDLNNGREIKSSHLLKIKSFDENLTEAQKKILKYKGVPLSDIEKVMYIPLPKEIKINEDGTKKLSNIINIPFEKDGTDWDRIFLSYTFRKIEREENLVYFEKENFIATLMAVNERRLNSVLVENLGYSIDEIPNNFRIMRKYLKTKERRSELTPYEKEQKKNLDAIKEMNDFMLVCSEYVDFHSPSQNIQNDVISTTAIGHQLNLFEPSVVCYAGIPIFMNEKSLFHIYMRHLSDYQLSGNKRKSVIPYTPDELSLLIERIIHQIDEEIAGHFKTTPEKEFYRENRMAIEYNGDFFAIRISPDGRIVTFYNLGGNY